MPNLLVITDSTNKQKNKRLIGTKNMVEEKFLIDNQKINVLEIDASGHSHLSGFYIMHCKKK